MFYYESLICSVYFSNVFFIIFYHIYIYLSNKIQVIHFITLQDRPERSKSTGHGYHNATHNTRWGWSSVFHQRMISCSKCFKHRTLTPNSGYSIDCTTCYDWNVNKVNIQLS